VNPRGVTRAAEGCQHVAHEVETAFGNVSSLVQEMIMACIHKAGSHESAEQILAQNKAHFEVLKVRKEGDQRVLDSRKKTTEMMMASFACADKDFHFAVKEIPTGWDLVGMQVVESIVAQVASASNAAISTYTLNERVATVGLEAFTAQAEVSPKVQTPPQNTNPQGISTLPDDLSLTDSSLLESPRTLQLVNALNMLIVGGEDGKPDWDKIGTKRSPVRLNLMVIARAMADNS
jgi:hypothetical protein